MSKHSILFSIACLCASSVVFAVQNQSELQTALQNLDATITIENSFGATENLFPVNSNLSFGSESNNTLIDGANFSLTGSSINRGFFIRGGSVTIQNLSIRDFTSKGGAGGRANASQAGTGGGGAGLGGAIFVSEGTTLTLDNVTFQNCSAEGGDGGSSSGAQVSSSAGFLADGDKGGGGGGGFLADGGNGETGGGGGGGVYVVMPATATGGSGSSGTGGGGGGALGGMGGSGSGQGGYAPQGGGSGGSAGNGGGGAASETTNGGNAIGPAGGAGGGGDAQSGGDSGVGFGGGGGGSGFGADKAANAGSGDNGTATSAGNGGNASASGFGGGGGGQAALGDPGNGGGGGSGAGAGGGGSNASSIGGSGGPGGNFGGGGGAGSGSQTGGNGGDGGFGAGGGGAGFGSTNPSTGGTGGFGGGGGGGGGNIPIDAAGGFGGGNAANRIGGGGAGFGGAIFVENGAILNINTFISFSGNSTTTGTGGNPGSTGGTDIFAISGAHMNFDLSIDSVIPTPIESDLGAHNPASSGGLTKSGPAMLKLNGANTYTGTTNVQAGELQIKGSTTSNIDINGGKLSGNFATIANGATSNTGKITLNSGTFSPGTNGDGTVTLAGEFIQNGGAFSINLTPSPSNSPVVKTVAGASIIDGNLEVFFGQGNYIAGTVYEVIQGPVSGNYPESNIIKMGPNADSINIEVTTGSLLITVLTTHLFQDQIINPGISQEVANCIIKDTANIDPNSDFAFVVGLLGTLNNKEVNDALIDLSPVRFGSLEWINARNNSLVADVLSQHLFDLCCSPRDCCDPCANTEAWIAGYGNFTDQHKKLDNLEPFDTTGGGVIAGIDWCCNPCFYFGGAVGYTHTDFDWNKHGGCGDINTYYGALYGSWLCNCFSVDLSLIGGGSDHDIKRKIQFPGLSRTAKSDPWGYFFTGHLGVRANWDCFCFAFEPFGKMDYHYFNRASFKEKGADSIDLKVRSIDQHFIRGEVGLRAYYTIYCDCYCWAPYIGGSWVGDFPLNDSDQKASFVGQSCVMDVESYDSSLQMGSPEVGFKFTHECGFSVLGEYKGIFNDKVRVNQFDVRLEWIF